MSNRLRRCDGDTRWGQRKGACHDVFTTPDTQIDRFCYSKYPTSHKCIRKPPLCSWKPLNMMHRFAHRVVCLESYGVICTALLEFLDGSLPSWMSMLLKFHTPISSRVFIFIVHSYLCSGWHVIYWYCVELFIRWCLQQETEKLTNTVGTASLSQDDSVNILTISNRT